MADKRADLIAEIDAVLATATPDELRCIKEARLLNARVDRMLALGYTQDERGDWVAPTVRR